MTPPRPALAFIFAATLALSACGPTPPAEVTVHSCLLDPACDTPLVVAHRGYSLEAPENTLASARAAIEVGAVVIEADVRQSSDGIWVVMHDATATRTTDQETRFPARPAVDALSAEELAQLRIRWPGCEAPEADLDRCGVPTLAALLEAVRGEAVIMLDFKGGDPASLGALIAAEDAADRAFLFDADPAALAAAQAEAPGLPLMPRAKSAAELEARLAEAPYPLVHVDPAYLAEAEAIAAPAGVKLFVNAFVDYDLNQGLFRELGDTEYRTLAQEGAARLLEGGADLIQSNLCADLRAELDRQRPADSP